MDAFELIHKLKQVLLERGYEVFGKGGGKEYIFIRMIKGSKKIELEGERGKKILFLEQQSWIIILDDKILFAEPGEEKDIVRTLTIEELADLVEKKGCLLMYLQEVSLNERD